MYVKLCVLKGWNSMNRFMEIDFLFHHKTWWVSMAAKRRVGLNQVQPPEQMTGAQAPCFVTKLIRWLQYMPNFCTDMYCYPISCHILTSTVVVFISFVYVGIVDEDTLHGTKRRRHDQAEMWCLFPLFSRFHEGKNSI